MTQLLLNAYKNLSIYYTCPETIVQVFDQAIAVYVPLKLSLFRKLEQHIVAQLSMST